MSLGPELDSTLGNPKYMASMKISSIMDFEQGRQKLPLIHELDLVNALAIPHLSCFLKKEKLSSCMIVSGEEQARHVVSIIANVCLTAIPSVILATAN